MSTTRSRNLRIGVDVGGTNTDGVVLDPSLASSPDKGIVAWHKAPTTPDPRDGINAAIIKMFEAAQLKPDDIASVSIGTTQFVNAVVERDARRLSKVAVIRLSGPFSKHMPPCIDWPQDLRELVLGYSARVKGGLEVDGALISDLDEEEIKDQCAIIATKGIRSIVVNEVFSPVDTVERQEERAAEVIRGELPGCHVVCAKDVANLGFIERENAAILNASILPFARRTIRSFQEPMKTLGLRCPVFITQNDGTVLSGDMAARLPIRTFSSGPTNSMRGAAYLVQGQVDEEVIVVDIGGTTTDAGLLLRSGFPRQQAAYSELAGVRMNFSCPDIRSIGLGGGSIVRKDGLMTVGPDSVGYGLMTEARIFGGSTLTATDGAVLANSQLDIGSRIFVEGALSPAEVTQFEATVKQKLETIIDRMKISPEDLPVILVGGGAIIAPDTLAGASKVIKPRWSEVANAVGTAIARVSATVDTVRSTESQTSEQVLEELKKEAIEKAVRAGAEPPSVKIAEVDVLPLSVGVIRTITYARGTEEELIANKFSMQYVANKSRFVVRAAGDFDLTRTDLSSVPASEATDDPLEPHNSIAQLQTTEAKQPIPETEGVDPASYKPSVKNGTWYISETDLEFINIGCYILGTGGGGSPYTQTVLLRGQLRAGAVVRVVSPQSLPDDALVGSGGGAGSPTVAIEKLSGDEMLESQRELYGIIGQQPTHMIAVEIGGANGLQGMILGSSFNMDVPAVDGDWMGRAYPTKWQTTPVVFDERSPIWSPVVMSDGNGNIVTMPRARSDAHVERVMRAALSEMGSQVGFADPPVSGAEARRWAVENTISQSWRIGRAVVLARKANRMSEVAEMIIEECGGREGARVLWKGKVVGVERTLKTGHVYGECIIEGMDVAEGDGAGGEGGGSPEFKGRIKIPFKNENIAAIKMRKDSTSHRDVDRLGLEERQEDVLAIVPDLIAVVDAQNGEAIGTPEYRYGQLVIVLGITASDRWTSTARGISLGGPDSFGFNHLRYAPLGKFVKPRSVIEEFDNLA
ncbi:related to D-amino acid hydantoin hydrolase (hydantoinase) [Cephalotrichum gorgonifer]|uniref:Related to D-amino acid hydantoin hydrolase (Hydantoinase) n=1 Tax=Cephalotrichum gorgonifer TaxID=2041049 RepID=A0AAE8MRY0_9PEZI|nr:related to D-amino acid hydantoin hydrolase (hydantoinase) [Cephalotrichum gorgonifer]